MTHKQATHFVLTVLACLLMWQPAARAAELPPSVMTARDLYGMCVSKYDTDVGFCTGYVTAVANRMATMSVNGFGPCNFAAARSQQFTNLFTAFAQGYPDTLGAPADSIIATSLGRAFPCARN